MSLPTPGAGSQGGVCPFCGLPYAGRPNQCRRCGTLMNDAVEDARRLGAQARRNIHTRRAFSDLCFLVGLLLGGPMIAMAGEVRLGLFIVLAGGLASVLRRYSNLSGPAAVIVGGVGAAIVATAVMETGVTEAGEVADAASREAFVGALAAPERDIFAEVRGPGSTTVWFTVPVELSKECGDYPPAEIRDHLGALGFARIVVRERNQSGGLCSFPP